LIDSLLDERIHRLVSFGAVESTARTRLRSRWEVTKKVCNGAYYGRGA
jgi:hypothetical protein